ncbi:subtilisin family serine protease [Kribbella sp. VKM Ac-2569]|uniref:S8 family serine peptidase n=1 Tax=Kribbella sp. VKM Ac-2569 TaxID=2512220 RepID=UPI00102ABDDF|nr:S8 family serine peptidase [Kribbella sp. VKM Ac-2569]RZT07799.1 subtilisin family serine protease [Kribbella sp. VKM Ac-2569]
MSRPTQLLRLALPAALVAAGLVALSGSSGSAAEPRRPYRPPFAGQHAAAKTEFEPNAVLVKFKPKATASARKAAVARAGATPDDQVSSNVVKVKGEAAAPDLLKKLKADPSVELASLNYKRHATAVPNDEYYGTDQAAYLNTVRMPQAWDLSKSTGSQIVAVLDTGVDAGHPDLVGHLVPGYNAVSSTRPNPVDDNGHGTMTLGIIAGAANNGIGVAGVGWNVKAMPVKVLDANGSGYDSDIAEGIDWAVAHGAKVINMSLGGPDNDPVLYDAIKRAYANGVVVVVAAGNDGSGDRQYPAVYPEAISVAATDATGSLTDFSSFGYWMDIAAPGVDILSTGPRNLTPPDYEPYWYCTGTSCSTPIVAGVAALVRNKWPSLTPAQVAQRLEMYSRDAGPRGIDQYYGHGNLDAYAALGGRFAPDFPTAVADGNDQPIRAKKLTGFGSTTGAIDSEGDVDWYSIDLAAAQDVHVAVTGPSYDERTTYSNVGPVVDVYDTDLNFLGHADNEFPVVDPVKGPLWGPLTAAVDVKAGAGTTYLAVRNYNGSKVTRPYTLTLASSTSGVAATGWAYGIRDVYPANLASGAPASVTPKVTFARDMDAASVPGSLQLRDGKTGEYVSESTTYDPATRTATLTPQQPLLDNRPYNIEATLYLVGADHQQVQPFSTVFTTADLAPKALTTFTGSGAYLAANLAWTIPPTNDLDQVIVRRNVGSKAPTPTTGTLVYAGTGTGVKNTGLAQSTTYTYAAWVVDRTGHYSPIAVEQLLGMKSGIAVTSTLLNYGGSITIKGSTLRIDNVAYAGLPVNVYVRPKTSSKFTLLAALKTSSTGTLSVTHKPLVSSVYMLTFPGNASLMGTRTVDVTVQVKPTISATLSPASIRLGGTTAFSGYVLPAHYGQSVYLQQYGNKVWKSIASVKLSSSGKYAFGIRPAVRGQIAYRVYFPGDADHAPAYTVNKIVTVS